MSGNINYRYVTLTREEQENGIVLCNECNGRISLRFEWKDICKKCFGCGKLDWIENIIGKKDPYSYYMDYVTYKYSKEILGKFEQEYNINYGGS